MLEIGAGLLSWGKSLSQHLFGDNKSHKPETSVSPDLREPEPVHNPSFSPIAPHHIEHIAPPQAAGFIGDSDPYGLGTQIING